MLGRGVGNVLGVGTEEQIERFIPSVVFLFRVSFYLWVGFVLFFSCRESSRSCKLGIKKADTSCKTG